LQEWDRNLLKYEGNDSTGACFQTSNAFCHILNDDFGIPCKIEMVESLIGNKKSISIFKETLRTGKINTLYDAAKKAIQEKGRENLTIDDPVLIGHHKGTAEYFHFIINLPEQGEALDLTVKQYQRPKWGISCKNYWAKYEKEPAKSGIFGSDQITTMSGCVLYSNVKKTPGKIGLDLEKYEKARDGLRTYIREQVKKRNIPVFMR
jgi:hypothetical protein